MEMEMVMEIEKWLIKKYFAAIIENGEILVLLEIVAKVKTWPINVNHNCTINK